MKKTGLITFHAPYNYGSVLQAYALQQVILNSGIDNEIINYRFMGQRDCYKIIRRNVGISDRVKDILQFPVFGKKIIRKNKFENFITHYLKLTKLYEEPEELDSLRDKFDLYISGSDQIWNKHSNELNNVDWKYMNPYLLTFTNKKKISYASSIGGMTNDEIKEIEDKIRMFDFVSAREVSVAGRLSIILKREVQCVVDPTLLLTAQQYIKLFSLEINKEKPYIFYYSLSGINTVRKHLQWIKKLNKRHGYKIIINTPYAYIPAFSKETENFFDMGPKDFLNTIYNATIIVTDSFHGTAFAVNFKKNFYTLCKCIGGSEYRKLELLDALLLKDRVIDNLDAVKEITNIDYSIINDRLETIIEKSKKYLFEALDLN